MREFIGLVNASSFYGYSAVATFEINKSQIDKLVYIVFVSLKVVLVPRK